MLALAFLGYSGPRTVGAEVPGSPDVSPSLQDILDKAHKGPLYTYPTSLTQGIIPVCLLVTMKPRILPNQRTID